MILRGIAFVLLLGGCAPGPPAPLPQPSVTRGGQPRRVRSRPFYLDRELSKPLLLQSCVGEVCSDLFTIPPGTALLGQIGVAEDGQDAAVLLATGPQVELSLFHLPTGTVVRIPDFAPGFATAQDRLGEWHGRYYFYGIYTAKRDRLCVYTADGSRMRCLDGGHVSVRGDGRFAIATPDESHADIVLLDVENGHRTSLGPNTSGSMDEVSWNGTEAILWWRNSSSRHVSLPTRVACCENGSPVPTGGSKPSSSARAPAATESTADAGVRWPKGVVAYPGARQLCQEHLTAHSILAGDEGAPRREIDWSSYAVADEAAQVIAFYKRNASPITVEVDGDQTTLRLESGVRLSVIALPTKRAFPSCTVALASIASTDRVLVVVHKQTVR